MKGTTDKTVVIDVFNNNGLRYGNEYAVVAVDVIRATTTAITGVALGRRCFPVSSVEEAMSLAKKLTNPLLAGELGGSMPYGFDLQNSPFQLQSRTDINRPMILLSTSGTRLITEFRYNDALYVACLRNFRALAAHLSECHPKVALIGAGTRGEFREEDELCCAWIAEEIIGQGYKPENEMTVQIVERYSGASVDIIREGNSAAYLRRTGQTQDLDFILTHVDDLNCIYQFKNDEIVKRALDVNETKLADEIREDEIEFQANLHTE
jgi:2-phosphosulfolactate phosphatase